MNPGTQMQRCRSETQRVLVPGTRDIKLFPFCSNLAANGTILACEGTRLWHSSGHVCGTQSQDIFLRRSWWEALLKQVLSTRLSCFSCNPKFSTPSTCKQPRKMHKPSAEHTKNEKKTPIRAAQREVPTCLYTPTPASSAEDAWTRLYRIRLCVCVNQARIEHACGTRLWDRLYHTLVG